MFDPPSKRYPKTWKEMSLDFKLIFSYHICMMVLMVLGRKLTLHQEILITAASVCVLISISYRHRKATHWHWPGIRGKDVLLASLAAIAIAFFLYAASRLFAPFNHNVLPWYFAALGIAAFQVLSSLRVVYQSEAEFLTHCRAIDQYGREMDRASELPEPKIVEANWKKIARGIYATAFLLIWVAGVSFFLAFGNSFKNGSETPTSARTETLTDHGRTVFVTKSEKQRLGLLQLTQQLGVPLVLVTGAILHFLLGVKLLPNVPTLQEYQTRKTHAG